MALQNIVILGRQINKQTDRDRLQTARLTIKQTHRKTEEETDQETNRRLNRQTNGQTDRLLPVEIYNTED